MPPNEPARNTDRIGAMIGAIAEEAMQLFYRKLSDKTPELLAMCQAEWREDGRSGRPMDSALGSVGLAPMSRRERFLAAAFDVRLISGDFAKTYGATVDEIASEARKSCSHDSGIRLAMAYSTLRRAYADLLEDFFRVVLPEIP